MSIKIILMKSQNPVTTMVKLSHSRRKTVILGTLFQNMLTSHSTVCRSSKITCDFSSGIYIK